MTHSGQPASIAQFCPMAIPAPGSWVPAGLQLALKARFFLLQLDLDVHASGQVELHQRIDSLVGGVNDVHQALVRADFELVAAGLVDVRRAQDVKTLHAGWQGHGALDNRACALGSVNDLGSGLVDQFVVKRFEADADFFAWWPC